MIKITRNDGKSILTVSRSAFEGIFRWQGYVLYETADGGQQNDDGGLPPSEDDLFRESVELKPIGQWNADELRQYAVLEGIDPKSKGLRELVKAVIDAKTADGGQQNDGDQNGND